MPHQWRSLDKTLIKRRDNAHSRILHLLHSSPPQIRWCQIPLSAQSVRSVPLMELKGAELPFLSVPAIRGPLLPLKQSSSRCWGNFIWYYSLSIKRQMYTPGGHSHFFFVCWFFFFLFFPFIRRSKPLAVSLATAKHINICSHSAPCYSALVNALLWHKQLCALPLNIHKH